MRKITSFFLLFLSFKSISFADPLGMNNVLCTTPQYLSCFGFSKEQCMEKSELAYGFCYRAFGKPHPKSAQLKPIALKIQDANIPTCGEAVYFYLYKDNFKKENPPYPKGHGTCDDSFTNQEFSRWSPTLVEFAKAASKK